MSGGIILLFFACRGGRNACSSACARAATASRFHISPLLARGYGTGKEAQRTGQARPCLPYTSSTCLADWRVHYYTPHTVPMQDRDEQNRGYLRLVYSGYKTPYSCYLHPSPARMFPRYLKVCNHGAGVFCYRVLVEPPIRGSSAVYFLCRDGNVVLFFLLHLPF